MSGFLYFLPNAKQTDVPANIEKWGLGYLRDESGKLHARGSVGPGGVHGFVVGSSTNFQPEEVKNGPGVDWQPFPKTFAENQAYLGVIDQKLPAPSDLIRAKTISGEALTLADGNRWLVPHAQVVTSDGVCTNLPVSYGLDIDSGDWISNQILPKYKAIWDHANKYLESMWASIDQHFESGQPDGYIAWDIPDPQTMIVDALQVNYRVSARELATLGVLTSDLATQIAKVLIDDVGYERLKKKEGLDTGLG